MTFTNLFVSSYIDIVSCAVKHICFGLDDGICYEATLQRVDLL